MNSLLSVSVCCLALAVVGCGDDTAETSRDEPSEGGAAAEDLPAPALRAEDCATGTSKLELSQPEGADVWGGLVVVEFEVEGAKTRNFDIQIFDPALDAWLNSYVELGSSGQRDDGTYFLAVRPAYSEANKDEELKLRVRPTQDGCPNAEWTESEGFTARNPISGTSWHAEIPSEFLNANIDVLRTGSEGVIGSGRVGFGDATLDVEIADTGELTQRVTIPLQAAAGEPFEDCTLSLTFRGTYELLLRSYGSMTLVMSPAELISTDGTLCAFPTVEELAPSAEDLSVPLPQSSQSVSIDYQPTLYVEPGAPVWQYGFGQIFGILPQYLSYSTGEETGSASGSVSPQELMLLRSE
jgi:hypothetical protein